ncbi:uncharacterized protein V1510DRAFT_422645 [Dipodascopsis tothii]|uniref:uncharacterized protein n=1 Tax=Dipodascopsis tothii TaxID=44089 RepID=UPI0034CFEAD0
MLAVRPLGFRLGLSSRPCSLVCRSPLRILHPPHSLRLFRSSAMAATSEPTGLVAQLSKLGISPSDVVDYPSSNIAGNPFDVFRAYISDEMTKLTGISRDVIIPALEWTQASDRGDLVLAVPRLRVKGAKPDELAAEWADKFPVGKFLEKVGAKGPFLQFFFSPTLLYNMVIPAVLAPNSTFGDSHIGEGKRILVEFSSPNIAKPFHAGHLRSTIIGGFISNLEERLGFDVIRMNYLGDWGKQFGLLAVGFNKCGSEEELVNDPIDHLFRVYVTISAAQAAEKDASTVCAELETAKAALAAAPADLPAAELAALKEAVETTTARLVELNKVARETMVRLDKSSPLKDSEEVELMYFADRPLDSEAREYFKRLEDGDKEGLALWTRFRDLSIVRYKDTYERLNIHYDEYSGESKISEQQIKDVQTMLESKNLITVDRGAKLIDFKPYSKKLGKALMQKSDGTSLYLSRDVGAAIDRYNRFKFDKMIYVVASQQDLHIAQLFKILELSGLPFADKCQHINFGMVQGMSTRKGTVVFLNTILEETKESMHEVMKKNQAKYEQIENPDEIADLVGISAVMIQDMQSKRINNYKFDWTRMLSFEGDTGPYLQYAHSRLCSMERRAGFSPEVLATADLSLLTEPIAEQLIRALAQYPDVLLNAHKTLEPSTVVNYLFKLTHIVSSCYNILWVAGQEEELAKARMALYSSAKSVINRGMKVLGLTPVERM